MRHLFSTKGLHELRAFTGERTLFAFDFDGTLTGIVSDPGDVLLPAKTARLLKQLSATAPVAVISGRALRYLKRLVPCPKAILIGNHGIEGLRWDGKLLPRLRAISRHWEAALRPLLEQTPGCVLEAKTYTLSLHYRSALKQGGVRKEMEALVHRLQPPPRIVLGKKVLNLIPQGAPDKGTAILRLMKDLKASRAIYVGDDWTDENVFSLGDPRILGIHVGINHRSAARWYLKRQSEINRLLEFLVQPPESVSSRRKSAVSRQTSRSA